MNPHLAYRQQQLCGWTRIDMLLALYDRAIERLERARTALQQNDAAGTESLLVDAQFLVAGLVSGVNLDYGDLPVNFLRLYEFALHQIRLGTAASVGEALRVLGTLREGVQEIRAEAAQMERDGAIPTLEGSLALQTTA